MSTSVSAGRAGYPASAVTAAVLGGGLLLLLFGPVAALVAEAFPALPGAVADPELLCSLLLTAGTATAATLLAAVAGTPLAWLLARRRFSGRWLLDALLDLPLVLPHPVAGIALVLVLGRQSALGGALADAGLAVVGSPVGIVVAMLFVAAPLYVSAARSAIAAVDASHEQVARTLGAGPLRAVAGVTIPMAARGLLAGAVVAWARAVSEFGAIVILAYNPKVVSVLTYERMTAFGLRAALPVAAALVLVSLVPLALLRALRRAGPAA